MVNTLNCFRFTTKHRLAGKEDIDRVFQNAKKVIGLGYILLATRNTLDHPRLGLAVSKKHARHAVDRNRIKRVSRESFRYHQYELIGLDIVVLARQKIVDISSKNFRMDLDNRWEKLAKEVRFTELCAK